MSDQSTSRSRKAIRWTALGFFLLLVVGCVSFLSARTASKNSDAALTAPASAQPEARPWHSDPLDYLHEETPRAKATEPAKAANASSR